MSRQSSKKRKTCSKKKKQRNRRKSEIRNPKSENKLWEYIEPRMDAAGLTVYSLAIRAGVTDPCMYRLKAGKSLPSEKTLERIAWVIRADIADLIWLRSQHPLYKKKAAGISKSVRERAPRTIICEHCGLPGETRSFNVKYPHEECVIAVRHARARDANKEFYKTHGISSENKKVNSMTQNEIILKNLKQEKKRECLKCERKFMSEGLWNRICPRCKMLNDLGIQPGRVCRAARVPIAN